jgi:hypothetical protein
MLKRDKQTFLEFISRDRRRMEAALTDLNARERGHFEDHPMSSRFIAEHIPSLIQIWRVSSVSGCRDWVAQFVADAGVADERLKPLIVSGLSDPSCRRLPTLLYLVSTRPEVFCDVGPLLLELARHPDKEVRWRVAYVISKMRKMDGAMHQAVKILRTESDHTTQVYVREYEKRA